MKLRTILSLTAVLALAHTTLADVSTKPVLPRFTNDAGRLPSLDTNLDNAERLLKTLGRVVEDSKKMSEALDALDDLTRLFENADKELDMFKGATNLIKLCYPSVQGEVTVMLVNAFASKGDSNVIHGRLHFLYPKAWRVSSSYYEREKASLPKQHCGINFRLGTNSLNWSLDLKKPFIGLGPTDRDVIKAEFEKITRVPFEKLRFDPADITPVWIADYSNDETADNKAK